MWRNEEGSTASDCFTLLTSRMGPIFSPTAKSHGVKRLDLLAAGRLWPESGTHAMGCGDEIHTALKLLAHHDFGLG